ncbi:hypothetical protein [Nocardioides pantholopis]|uniref:hypothetical protein n=1 Tax=Nocardioides pantholopis TaxID=2483798 RepID=UPI000F099B60|nr:hypothetical protein [Nocardioides pantholopis]
MSIPAALAALLAVPVPTPPASSPTEAALVGSLLVEDTGLPGLDRTLDAPLTLVTTGGAGQVAGPAAYAAREGLALGALRVTLRDLDAPAANVRRVLAAVDAARADGALAEDVPVQVEVPDVEPSYSWLAAADEIAGAELHLALPAQSPALARWVDVALDRETPFACTRGTGRALAAAGAPGALGLLAATVLAFDGAGSGAVGAALAATDPTALPDLDELARARRWLTAVDAPGTAAAAADLRDLGMLA